MNPYHIHIKNVTLKYPSQGYNALTLKEEVFKFLRVGKPTKLLLDITALKNINLAFNEGEKVGIMGRNGAGKSTLLKAIAGIYPVQEGCIETMGKIRAMFELNLGFEFEATGRENIIYRGLLLGETPKSIKAKTQEIISFSELGEFIDYPIKTYSSGMLIRLAFAISTTIQGDILLLDEILSAGDIAFQKKAQQRMESLIDQARIIVFVSHDIGALKRICNRGIVMDKGECVYDGKIEESVDYYLHHVMES